MLTGEELSSAYASADVFVMPSETETLGFVALEAMASGLPVVAVAAGGLVDIVTQPGVIGARAGSCGRLGYPRPPGVLPRHRIQAACRAGRATLGHPACCDGGGSGCLLHWQQPKLTSVRVCYPATHGLAQDGAPARAQCLSARSGARRARGCGPSA